MTGFSDLAEEVDPATEHKGRTNYALRAASPTAPMTGFATLPRRWIPPARQWP
jgi:hypothetical protein